MNIECGARELPANRGGETQNHETVEEHDGPWSRVLYRVAGGGAILLAAIAISMMLSNCGGEKSSSSTSGSGVAVADPLPASTPPVASPVTTSLPVETKTEKTSESPDFTVSASQDTMVVPGESVELLVQATGDVASVTLWDGLHDRQSFEYDQAAKAWRVTYRVPMQPAWSRIGLSVLAKNDANRWARRWVFLSVDREPRTEGGEDSE